jgi:hypothetical protein
MDNYDPYGEGEYKHPFLEVNARPVLDFMKSRDHVKEMIDAK